MHSFATSKARSDLLLAITIHDRRNLQLHQLSQRHGGLPGPDLSPVPVASYTATHFLPNTSSSGSRAGEREQQRSRPLAAMPGGGGASGSGGRGLTLSPAACGARALAICE